MIRMHLTKRDARLCRVGALVQIGRFVLQRGRCYLCGEKMFRNAPPTDPHSATHDHVVPKSAPRPREVLFLEALNLMLDWAEA